MRSPKRRTLVVGIGAAALAAIAASGCGLLIFPIHESDGQSDSGDGGAGRDVSIACGSETCVGLGARCCVTTPDAGVVMHACIPPGSTCLNGAAIRCDDPTDCAASEACCGVPTSGDTYCDPSPCAATNRTMCDPDASAPCGSGKMCVSVDPEFPGYSACQ